MPAMDYSRIAHLYDMYVKTELDVPFFMEEAKGRESVLELTSGTGRLSIPMIEAGIPLTCVDSSGDMLEVLRSKLDAKGLSAELHEMDMCGLDLGRLFDLIIIPFNSFSEITNTGEQTMALDAIRRHLSEDGRFILTLHNPAVRRRSVTGEEKLVGEFPVPDGDGKLAVSSVENYDASTHCVKGVQLYRMHDGAGAVVSELSIDIMFYLHEKDDVERMLGSSGLRVERLFGDYSRTPFDNDGSPFMIWRLKAES